MILTHRRHKRLARYAETRDGTKRAIGIAEHGAELGFANAHRVCQHGLEDRLQARRANLRLPEHLGGRGLLLQRLAQIVGALAQLVEQPGVLNGDDGLGCKVREQIDLLVAEGADLLAVDGDSCRLARSP